jgi:flagellar biosynthesis component FlhA
MVQRIGLWLSVVLIVAVMWLLTFTPAEPKDFIALLAVVVACLAWWQSHRSANAATRSAIASTKSASIAEANEERSKYGWTVTLHANGDHYVLRNVGTLAAHDVKFGQAEGARRHRPGASCRTRTPVR